jgi:hypothetical protein
MAESPTNSGGEASEPERPESLGEVIVHLVFTISGWFIYERLY